MALKRKFYFFTENNKIYETKVDNNKRLVDILNIEKPDPYNKEYYFKNYLKLLDVKVIEISLIEKKIRSVIRETHENIFLNKEEIILGFDSYETNKIKVDPYRKRSSMPNKIYLEISNYKIEGTVYNLYQRLNSATDNYIGIVKPKFYSEIIKNIIEDLQIKSNNFCIINKNKIKYFKIIN